MKVIDICLNQVVRFSNNVFIRYSLGSHKAVIVLRIDQGMFIVHEYGSQQAGIAQTLGSHWAVNGQS